MARVRVSTTVDEALLNRAREVQGESATDSVLLEAALHALIADRRAAEIERAYAVYDDQPLSDADEWGDLESFHEAVSRSRTTG